jgi:hypothetical protein
MAGKRKPFAPAFNASKWLFSWTELQGHIELLLFLKVVYHPRLFPVKGHLGSLKKHQKNKNSGNFDRKNV